MGWGWGLGVCVPTVPGFNAPVLPFALSFSFPSPAHHLFSLLMVLRVHSEDPPLFKFFFRQDLAT